MIDDNGHWQPNRPYDYEREEIFDLDYDPDPVQRTLDELALVGFLLVWSTIIILAVILFQPVRGG